MLKRFKFLSPIFVVTVLVPTALAVLYFGLLSDDVYVSESRFVVRSPSRSGISPLGMVLSGGGLTGSSEESNAVSEYLQSRRAMEDTDRDGLLRRAYGNPAIFWLDRFGGYSGTSREELYEYFQGKLAVDDEATTQVTRLTVRAYDPKQAQTINARLLNQAETLVNRLSDRSRADAVAAASAELEEAKNSARKAALALGQYRNRKGIIDPEKEATVRLQMISKLQDELIATRTQLQQMQAFTPQASQIPYLRKRITSLEGEIGQQMSGIAGGTNSLSSNAPEYQRLLVDSELAEKQVAAALASLEDARSEARRKRAYVERISDPSLPDYPAEPRRIRGILATLILGLLAWGVLSTLIVGIREHRD
ncbi:hypothetical protein [Altererythrobacter fulvus]|uniref:hypothetical protein n=1 Tax=Caenibius fulvus TaxID=2126012 RepID=UPI00301A003A